MLVEILQDGLVKDGVTLVSEDIQVAPERYQVGLELGGDILSRASGAHTVPRAVMTVPIFVPDNILQTVVAIGTNAEMTELPVAVIIEVV